MKLTATYILLFFYTSAVFKPVVPYILDFIAHSFYHEHHMATVHHSYGKDHVHIEAEKAATEDGNHGEKPKHKDIEPFSVHIVFNTNFTLHNTFSIEENYSFNYLNIAHPFLKINIPPPKFL